MHRVILEASLDVILFAVPLLAVLVPGFSRLNRLIASVKNEERGMDYGFEAPAWNPDADRRPLLRS